MEIKHYVVSFLFTPDFKNVWMIEKQKPEWQKGCLNGIGGKVENEETYKEAAIRELTEESGIFKNDISEVGSMSGKNNNGENFKAVIFTGITDEQLFTTTNENIELIKINEIKNFNHIENVPMIVESCLLKEEGYPNAGKWISYPETLILNSINVIMWIWMIL